MLLVFALSIVSISCFENPRASDQALEKWKLFHGHTISPSGVITPLAKVFDSTEHRMYSERRSSLFNNLYHAAGPVKVELKDDPNFFKLDEQMKRKYSGNYQAKVIGLKAIQQGLTVPTEATIEINLPASKSLYVEQSVFRKSGVFFSKNSQPVVNVQAKKLLDEWIYSSYSNQEIINNFFDTFGSFYVERIEVGIYCRTIGTVNNSQAMTAEMFDTPKVDKRKIDLLENFCLGEETEAGLNDYAVVYRRLEPIWNALFDPFGTEDMRKQIKHSQMMEGAWMGYMTGDLKYANMSLIDGTNLFEESVKEEKIKKYFELFKNEISESFKNVTLMNNVICPQDLTEDVLAIIKESVGRYSDWWNLSGLRHFKVKEHVDNRKFPKMIPVQKSMPNTGSSLQNILSFVSVIIVPVIAVFLQ